MRCYPFVAQTDTRYVQRAENKSRLHDCRIAMTVEKSADLLRQRADHNEQHSREIEKLNARFQDEKASMQRRVDDADSARQQEAMQRQQAEMTLRINTKQLTEKSDQLAADLQAATQENNELLADKDELSRQVHGLAMELDGNLSAVLQG